MKYTMGLLMGMFLSLGVTAQNTTPTMVLNAFSERLPEVANPFWEYREGAFVAMYAHEDGLKKVFFDKEGQWLETRTRQEQDALPKGVKNFINDHYAGADITYVGEVEQPSRTIYRVESELLSYVVIKLLNKKGDLLQENRIDWSFIPN